MDRSVPMQATSVDGATARTYDGDLDMNRPPEIARSPLEFVWDGIASMLTRGRLGMASMSTILRVALVILALLTAAGVGYNVVSTTGWALAVVQLAPGLVCGIGLYASMTRRRWPLLLTFVVGSGSLIVISFALTVTVNWYSFFGCPNVADTHWKIAITVFQSCGYNLFNLLIFTLQLLVLAWVVRVSMSALIIMELEERASMTRSRFSRGQSDVTHHGQPGQHPTADGPRHAGGTVISLPRIPSRGTMASASGNQFTEIDAKLESAQSKRFYPQMVVIYLIFVGIVVAASLIGWTPGVSMINLVPYACSSLIVLETGRFYLSSDASSFVPLFLNIVPMGFLVSISREAHALVAVMFFFSTFIIQLQFTIIAHRHKKTIAKPVLLYVLACVGVYMGAVAFIQSFYTDPIGTDQFRGSILLTPVDWSREVTIAIALLFCGLGFSEFAHVFSSSLSTHINSIKLLAQQNLNLKRALRRAKDQLRVSQGPNARNLDAPLSKAMNILQDLMGSGINPETRDLIDEALLQLGSENIFRPDLSREDVRLLHPELAMSYVGRSGGGNGDGDGNDARDVDSNRLPVSLARAAGSMDFGGMMERRASDAGAGVGPGSVTPAHDHEEVLATVGAMISDWNCNPFRINIITNNHPILYTTTLMFHAENLINQFNLDEVMLRKFLLQIEKGYLHNPYHNAIHAADITVTFYNFLQQGLRDRLSNLEIFCSLIACVIHDYRHPGFTNAFQVATDSDMALQFNDRAVLENYHLVAFFSLLRVQEMNIFKSLTRDQRRSARRLIITMVLATDLSEHFNILNKFKAKHESNALDLDNESDRSLMLQTAIKCCDVSNPAKSVELARLWSACVMTEFRRQGDAEKRLGIAQSPFMDRNEIGALQKCQESFIDFLCAPLFDVWSDFMGTTLYPLAIAETRGYWATLTEQDVADVVASTCEMIGIDPATGYAVGQPQKNSSNDLAVHVRSPLYTIRRLGTSPSADDQQSGDDTPTPGEDVDAIGTTLTVPVPGAVMRSSSSGPTGIG